MFQQRGDFIVATKNESGIQTSLFDRRNHSWNLKFGLHNNAKRKEKKKLYNKLIILKLQAGIRPLYGRKEWSGESAIDHEGKYILIF